MGTLKASMEKVDRCRMKQTIINVTNINLQQTNRMIGGQKMEKKKKEILVDGHVCDI